MASSDPQIRVIIRALEKVAERVVKQVVLGATANLIETTPIDTGWARANWVPSIGESRQAVAGTRAAAELGRVDKGPQQRGIFATLAYKLRDGEVYITNNVPYIRKLNDGSSRQAPAGFVQAAVLRAVREAAGVK